MPRKQYPSDHRRWFRVNEDLLDDDKLSKVSADVFRFYFRLLAMLNRTKSRDGKITLDRWALNAVAMRDRHGAALALARCGAGAGLVRLRYENGTAFVEVPKWPEIQELTPAGLRQYSDETPPPKTTPKTTPTPTKKEERDAPPALVTTSIRWGEVCEAFSAYLPRSSRLVESESRRARMSMISKQFGPDAPINAVHGYAALHFTKAADPGFDPKRNFTPETIWRAGNISKYLDADRAAKDSGLSRPYGTPTPSDSVRDMTLRIASRIKAERGW